MALIKPGGLAKVPVKKMPKGFVEGRVYSTYQKPPPKGKTGSVLQLGKNQVAGYTEGLGFYARPKPKITVDVKRGGTAQNFGTSIESPAQIEARVTRMAQAAYDRQQGDLDAEVAKMRKEAEGRRLGMIAAYQAAGNQNAEMASKVQSGWDTAANNLQGLAGATTGGIGDALRADTAQQEAALARVGAGGTGFDATSQQGVEQYRGGALPAEAFTRYGGIANEYLQRMPDNLKREGLAGAYAAEHADLDKIASDRLTQVRTLGENRTKYESDLREQLLGARKDQIDAVNDSKKILADVAMKRATLESQYRTALLSATTKLQIQAAKDIYAASDHALDVQESNALVAQRNASAGLSIAKTGQALANPTGAKPPSGTAISNNVVRANKAGTQALDSILQNIWANAPGATPPPGTDPKEYVKTQAYAAAVAWNKRQRTRSFKTAITKVTKAIAPHLKAVNYTPLQVRQLAWEIVSAKVTPPAGLKAPGTKAGAAPVANVFGTPAWMNP